MALAPTARRALRRLKPWSPLVVLAVCVVAYSAFGPERPKAPRGFTVLMDGAPKSLDPRFATGDFSVKLSKLVFSGLVSIDNPSGAPELDLAASIEQTTPTTLDIALRPDATWHDGAPVTAHDVAFTLDSLADPDVSSPFAGLRKRIASITVHDDRRLTIALNAPHAPFLSDLTMGIVPRHRMDAKGRFPDDVLVGSGPFQFEARHGDAWVALKRFDRYHGGAPELERVIFRVLPDDNARLLAMIGGSGQLMQNAVTPLLLPAVQGDRSLVIESSPSIKYTYLGFNTTHPILKHKRVRQAIAHGIDREAIIRYKFSGLARLSTGLLPPHHWAYSDDVPTYTHDPARARELLDAAGFPDPDGDGPEPRFELVYKTTTNQFRRAVAELIKAQLAEVGIRLRIQAYEWGTFFHDIKSRNFELCSLQWVSVTEPDLYTWIFHSKSIPTADNRSAGANRGAYSNPALDALLDQGRVETDPDKRRAIYHRVQALVADELPYVSLWHEDNILVRQDSVRDYQIVPNARFWGLAKTRWTP